MQKQYVRKMQKMGNGLGLRVPPELCQEAEVGRGDNVSLEFNPDSGGLKLGKVAMANPGLDDVRQQDETHENSESNSSENKSTENESRVDLADEKGQSQQAEVSKFEFCTSCGSDDIRVTGNQFYCFECDVTYEVTPRGTKIVATNPPKEQVDEINHRIDDLEKDVDELLNNKPGDDEDDEEPHGFIWFEPENAHVAVGASSDEDEETEPEGFITG